MAKIESTEVKNSTKPSPENAPHAIITHENKK